MHDQPQRPQVLATPARRPDRSGPRSRNSPPSPRFRATASVLILGVSAVLLLASLGHYALWEDEAMTALAAQGVLRTGDTSAVLGNNIVAFRNGELLRGDFDRSTPPLPAYLAAPFLAALGPTAFAARLPFALLGLATVAVLVRWLWRDADDRRTWVWWGLAIVTNVSFFLYCRNCRYYAVAIFVPVAVAYLYTHDRGRLRGALAISLLMATLFASQYLNWALLAACLLLDYALWGRRTFRLSPSRCAALLLPQLVLGALLLWHWNVFQTGSGDRLAKNSVTEKLWLVWWNLRDANAAEFGIGLLVLAAPVVYWFRRDPWLLRGTVAVAAYCVLTALTSPQVVSVTSVADIRYHIAIIPAYMGLAVAVMRSVDALLPKASPLLAALAFPGNLLHLNWVQKDIPLRSTPLMFAFELATPPRDPFSAAANWLRDNVPAGKPAVVLPTVFTYPLTFHAPHLTYGWQFSDPPPKAFADVAPIQITGRSLPAYFVVFGPDILKFTNQPVPYDLAAKLDVFYQPVYRPELLWRRFEAFPIPDDNRDLYLVYVLRRRD